MQMVQLLWLSLFLGILPLWAKAQAAQISAQAAPSILPVTVDQAEKLVAEKKVVVLDVRTPKEFSAGHIAGATNVDFNAKDFALRLKTLDKDKPYLLHCAVGGRSSKAVEQMKALKFKTVYHMEQGMKGWEKAGKPVEK